MPPLDDLSDDGRGNSLYSSSGPLVALISAHSRRFGRPMKMSRGSGGYDTDETPV